MDPGVVEYFYRKYLAEIIAATLCAPQDDNDDDENEDMEGLGEDENGIFIATGG
jgi:hypothetical protein